VLTDFSLEVAPGEFLALTGPSGAGKTTILNLIGGLDLADSGDVVVAETDLTYLSDRQLSRWRARHIGVVFQSNNLLPGLSAAENVELPLLLTQRSRAECKQRVAAILEAVGLSDRAQHRPGELSGGQQQRVGIARAMVGEVPILLCDEPTGDLDRANADEILRLLETLNRERGTTIVMVTHDEEAASRAHCQLNVEKGALRQVVAP
jgi:putative ABC transport system ATP-binding protein